MQSQKKLEVSLLHDPGASSDFTEKHSNRLTLRQRSGLVMELTQLTEVFILKNMDKKQLKLKNLKT